MTVLPVLPVLPALPALPVLPVLPACLPADRRQLAPLTSEAGVSHRIHHTVPSFSCPKFTDSTQTNNLTICVLVCVVKKNRALYSQFVPVIPPPAAAAAAATAAPSGNSASSSSDTATSGGRQLPRFFTPREVARLQGFPESFVLDGLDGVDQGRLYHQLGNAVSPMYTTALVLSCTMHFAGLSRPNRIKRLIILRLRVLCGCAAGESAYHRGCWGELGCLARGQA